MADYVKITRSSGQNLADVIDHVQTQYYDAKAEAEAGRWHIVSTAAPHTHPATDIVSSTLDGDRLPAMSAAKKGGVPATGTPSGMFLKDDGTWATPAGGPGGSTNGYFPGGW